MKIEERKKLIGFYKEQVNSKIKNHETTDFRLFLQEQMDVIKYDNDLMTVWYLGMVAEKEKSAGKKSIFDKVDSLEAFMERYQKLKFFVRRIEYDILDSSQEFYLFLANENVSEFELMGIVDSCAYHKEKVWKFFG